MKLTSVTLFFAVFSLCMIFNIARRVKQERTGIRSALVWFILWGAIGFFSLFPGLLNWATRFAQMESRIIFILLLAVFVLFAFMFSVTTRLDRQQRNIEKLVQEIALANFRIDTDLRKGKNQGGEPEEKTDEKTGENLGGESQKKPGDRADQS